MSESVPAGTLTMPADWEFSPGADVRLPPSEPHGVQPVPGT